MAFSKKRERAKKKKKKKTISKFGWIKADLLNVELSMRKLVPNGNDF